MIPPDPLLSAAVKARQPSWYAPTESVDSVLPNLDALMEPSTCCTGHQPAGPPARASSLLWATSLLGAPTGEDEWDLMFDDCPMEELLQDGERGGDWVSSSDSTSTPMATGTPITPPLAAQQPSPLLATSSNSGQAVWVATPTMGGSGMAAVAVPGASPYGQLSQPLQQQSHYALLLQQPCVLQQQQQHPQTPPLQAVPEWLVQQQPTCSWQAPPLAPQAGVAWQATAATPTFSAAQAFSSALSPSDSTLLSPTYNYPPPMQQQQSEQQQLQQQQQFEQQQQLQQQQQFEQQQQQQLYTSEAVPSGGPPPLYAPFSSSAATTTRAPGMTMPSPLQMAQLERLQQLQARAAAAGAGDRSGVREQLALALRRQARRHSFAGGPTADMSSRPAMGSTSPLRVEGLYQRPRQARVFRSRRASSDELAPRMLHRRRTSFDEPHAAAAAANGAATGATASAPPVALHGQQQRHGVSLSRPTVIVMEPSALNAFVNQWQALQSGPAC